VGSTLGIQFYNDSKELVDTNVHDLNGHLTDGVFLCDAKYGADKDVCYLVLATARSYHGMDVKGMCENIDSDFFRFSCIRSTGGFDE